MAKTIKELYDKAICKAEFSPEPSLAFAEGFELGANAIIEEIEKVLNSARYLSDLSCKKQLYDNLVSLVEQLKKE